MSRSFVIVTSSLVCASVACTVNGRAVGPHLAVTTPRVVASASVAAPPPSDPPSEAGDNPMLTVPNVLGMPADDARRAVRSAGFKDDPYEGAVTPTSGARVADADCAPGIVCGQSPAAGEQIGRMTGVTIEIGDVDAAWVTVPDVTGMTKADADRALKTAGAKYRLAIKGEQGACAAGVVCDQEPAPGTRLKRRDAIVSGRLGGR